MHVLRERLERGAVAETQLQIPVTNPIAPFVHRPHNELLPRHHRLLRAAHRCVRAFTPRSIRRARRHPQGIDHHLLESRRRRRENAAVIHIRDRIHRHIILCPIKRLHARVVRAVGREIEDHLTAVQGAAGPSHRTVGARAVRLRAHSAIAARPAEHEHIRRGALRIVKAFGAEQVGVRQIPAEPTTQLECVEHLIARFEKVGAQLLASLHQRPEKAAPLVRQRRPERGRRQRDHVLHARAPLCGHATPSQPRA